MKTSCTNKPTLAIGLAALACALALGSANQAAAQGPAPIVPDRMTIKIFNNETDYYIYPVYSTGISAPKPDNWLQAWFKVPVTDSDKRPFLKTKQFRFYINPEGTTDDPRGGIPPKGSVTFTVPLFTQQVATTDDDRGTKPDQYIDWWGGGRIEIFVGPKTAKAPPAALTALYTGSDWKSQSKLDTSKFPAPRTLPVCTNGCPTRQFQLFQDTAGLATNEPSQLIEFSLGAVPQVGNFYKFVPNNVDIDVSYVDGAFLPAAIAPFNPDLATIAQVGYVGSPMKIKDFQCGLTRFLGLTNDPQDSCYVRNPPGKGWPQFIDRQGNTILKVPSLINLFNRDFKQKQPDLTPMKPAPNNPWPPIAQMQKLWNQCITGTDYRFICQDIMTVREMFKKNYDNYNNNYKKAPLKAKCDQTKTPLEYSEERMIAHVYGFTPFNDFCAADANLLADTTGYTANQNRKFQQVKDVFDRLMYWPTGEFAPYVGMIHNKPYLNIPNVYAYSVDDAMGNLQVEGKGMIIAVGGTRGLPNPNPAAPPVTFGIGYKKPDQNNPNPINFTHYAICTTDTKDTAKWRELDPDSPAFDVSITADNVKNCPISLIESKDPSLVYVVKLKQEPPFTFDFDPTKPPFTDKTLAPIDCSGNPPGSRQEKWCRELDPNDKNKVLNGVYAYSEHPPGGGRGTGKHHVITTDPRYCSIEKC